MKIYIVLAFLYNVAGLGGLNEKLETNVGTFGVGRAAIVGIRGGFVSDPLVDFGR